jgi:hypothetical protein
MEDREILNVFVDASIMLESIIDSVLAEKRCFTESFIKALDDHLDQVGAIYATMGFESRIKYDLGVVLQKLELQQARVIKHGIQKKRKSDSYRAKEEAYSDPEVAALAEYTVGGLKTRNKCYKR